MTDETFGAACIIALAAQGRGPFRLGPRPGEVYAAEPETIDPTEKEEDE